MQILSEKNNIHGLTRNIGPFILTISVRNDDGHKSTLISLFGRDLFQSQRNTGNEGRLSTGVFCKKGL